MARRVDTGTRSGLLWLRASPTHGQLRASARRAKGDVLLTVEVARDRALLSDFEGWHEVLKPYLHVPRIPGESDAGWEARRDALDGDFSARSEPYWGLAMEAWPEPLRDELEKSWETTFDPVSWARGRTRPQAVVRDLSAENVVRAIRIRDRKRTRSSSPRPPV